MTPYAELLVKPVDADNVIRRAYHALARHEHPDAHAGVPGPRWTAITAAYGEIRTTDRRDAWTRRQARLTRFCNACRGYGVTWQRTGTRALRERVNVCTECHGEGRTR